MWQQGACLVHSEVSQVRLDEAIHSGRPFRRTDWDHSMWLHVVKDGFDGCGVVEFVSGTTKTFVPLSHDLSADDYVLQELAVWDLVLADMAARDKLGKSRYGTRLHPHNGRDVLKDAYEEALDLAVYLRQALYERDGK